MNAKKQLWSLGHFVLFGVGFGMTCSGAYLLSLQTEDGHTWKVTLAYVITLSGFLATLAGVFWTICRSLRSKLYQRRGGREQQIQVHTVQREGSFPPSYEESQGSWMCPDTALEFVVVVDGVDVVMTLAPPLYSQDSSEPPDCTRSWEQPPRYSQVECSQQGEEAAACWGEVLSRS